MLDLNSPPYVARKRPVEEREQLTSQDVVEGSWALGPMRAFPDGKGLTCTGTLPVQERRLGLSRHYGQRRRAPGASVLSLDVAGDCLGCPRQVPLDGYNCLTGLI